MPKWVYPTAFVFLLFLIFTQPATAGAVAGDFAGFVGDMLQALGQFLSGLFGGATTGGELQSGASSSSGVTVPTPPPTEQLGHTHDFSGQP